MTTISSQPPLDRKSFERLLEAADTYRELLVCRLCGDVGMVPAELARLEPGDIERVREEPERYVLRVPERTPGDEESTDEPDSKGHSRAGRIAFLPSDIERELTRYVRSNAIDDDERIFPVTPRRLQMLVSAVADRAADRFDEPSLASVSSSDLRRHFAYRTLVTHDINPRVVKAVGGWHSFEALEAYLPPPETETVVAAFEPFEGTGSEETSRSPTPSEERNGLFRRFRSVVDAVSDASDHTEIEIDACEVLVGDVGYAFAWIDRVTVQDDGSEWRTSSGIDSSAIERLRPASADDTLPDGVDVVEVDGSVADERFDGRLARVAVVSGDTVYGTLAVASDREDAFGSDERAWLETIGRQIGYAIGAVRRRNLLLSDSILELEFVSRDSRSFFVDVSARLECRFEIDSFVPVSEATQVYYVTLEKAPPAAVFDLAKEEPGVDDCRLIETFEDGWRIEIALEQSSPMRTLTEYGVTVLKTVVEDGTATITGECGVDIDVRSVVTGLRSVFPESELAGKREVDRTAQTAREFRSVLEDRLTERQQAALRAAYFGGYYDWPRESTAEEVADAMGVSSPTLHNHLRKGQHELLRTFFDEESNS